MHLELHLQDFCLKSCTSCVSTQTFKWMLERESTKVPRKRDFIGREFFEIKIIERHYCPMLLHPSQLIHVITRKEERLLTISENKSTTWLRLSRAGCERRNPKRLSIKTLCDRLLVQNVSKNELPCNPWLELITPSDVECRWTTSSPLSAGR